MSSSDRDDSVREHLRICLWAAVPLHVIELRRRPWLELQKLATEAAQIVAEKGDIIRYRSKKKGETAAAFNSLARGIAILSFCPGGVKFLDDRYENEHDDTSARDPR